MADLSGYLGISQQRVLQLTQKGIITRGDDKLVSLRQAVPAYVANIKEQSNGVVEDEESGLKFKSYAERDNYYKSEGRRIELKEKLGELYPHARVEEMFYAVIELSREALLMLPDILERDADLTAKQVKAVEKFADRKLKSLANDCEKLGAGYVES